METRKLFSKIAAALLITTVAVSAQTVTVNLSEEHQTIKGYGGINHPNWYSDLNAAERELAFGNGDRQLGLTVLRTYVSDQTSQWGDGLATTQRAFELGATVFATPWNPPADMTYNDATGQKCINTSYFGAYADHLNNYVAFMKNNGVDLYAISVQNEPDYAHEWTKWTPQECVNFIKGYADQIDCKLMTPESFQYIKSYYDPILNDADALANVAIFGTHLYGTLYSAFPYALFEQKGAGKELWMTEVYTDSDYDGNLWNDGIINENHHALKVAEHIHQAMVLGNFQTYVYWPIRRYYALIHDGVGDKFGNPAAAAGSVTKRGWCMAQFSKFVRPGYVRVGATAQPISGKNVFVSAYKDGENVVIVAVNKTTSSQNLSFSIPGTSVASWETYTTSATQDLQKGSDVSGSYFSFTMGASSVTTFVGKADAQSPSVEITTPTTYAAPATVTIASEFSDPNPGDSVVHIKYYNGDTQLVDKWVYPFVYNWENVEAGTYTIAALAYDLDGNTATDTVTIKVNPAQESYSGIAHTIPGTVQCEDYDIGGNSFAYYDDSQGSETGVDYRTDEDVDIEVCTDADGGYNIGYATAGEWLEYTVNVATAGTYDLTIRAACSGDNRTVSLTSDGAPIATDIAIPNTGGWQDWTNVTVEDIQLDAGEQVLRLTIGDTAYINLNYMTFTEQTTGVTAPVTFEMNGLAAYPNPMKESGMITVPDVKDAQVIIYDNQEEVKAEFTDCAGTTVPWSETGITESGVYTVILTSQGKEYARIQVYVTERK